jgi:hypothetical protein
VLPSTFWSFLPVLHSAAGIPYAQPGILDGLLKPPTSFNASFDFIFSRFLFLLYHNLVCLSPACCLKLEAWSLALEIRSGYIGPAN